MASLCKYVESHGPVKASALHVDAYYICAVRKLPVTSLKMHVPDAVLERQFKTMIDAPPTASRYSKNNALQGRKKAIFRNYSLLIFIQI